MTDVVPWDEGNVAKAIDTYWLTSPMEIEWRRLLIEDMKQTVFTEPRPYPILEVGCGSGLIYEAMELAGLTTPELYVGGDVSKSMLELARSRYDATFQELDGLKLPFEDRSQENVICVSVLQHLPDYQQALLELLRVTRKRLYIALWMRDSAGDDIQFGGKFFNNTYSLRLFSKLTQSKQPTIRHLYLSNYSVLFVQKERK